MTFIVPLPALTSLTSQRYWGAGGGGAASGALVNNNGGALVDLHHGRDLGRDAIFGETLALIVGQGWHAVLRRVDSIGIAHYRYGGGASGGRHGKPQLQCLRPVEAVRPFAAGVDYRACNGGRRNARLAAEIYSGDGFWDNRRRRFRSKFGRASKRNLNGGTIAGGGTHR